MDKAPHRPGPITQTALAAPRALPTDPVAEKVVLWRVFRTPEEAIRYSGNMLLSDGQHLIGGTARDHVGPLFWVGVSVDDLARWGHRKAIQMTDGVDGQNTEPRLSR